MGTFSVDCFNGVNLPLSPLNVIINTGYPCRIVLWFGSTTLNVFRTCKTVILVICPGINTSKFVAIVQSSSCHLTEEIEERREKELASSKV